MELTQAYLKTRLHYDPLTGVFTWLPCKEFNSWWHKMYSGKEAGSVQTNMSTGYRIIRMHIGEKRYVASHLAWLYMTGSMPSKFIDHINHDATDNRWANLREVTVKENARNASKSRLNTSGVTGVYLHTDSNKWQARIIASKGRAVTVLCDTFEEAVAKRKELEIQYAYHPNHGSEKIAA